MAAARSFRAVFGSLGSVAKCQTSLLRKDGTSCIRRLKHGASVQAGATAQTLELPRWQLCAAVCMTRLPLVCPDPSEIGKKYIQLLQKQEFERSVLSEWEMEKMRQMEIIRAIEMGDKDAEELDFKATHQDIEDSRDEKLKEFLQSNTEIDAVDDSDTKNINRKMKESLVYAVKKKFGNDEVWVLPHVPLLEHETMRECADRALFLHSTEDFKGTIFSNAPSAFYKYKFPKGVRLKNGGAFSGAKVFIYSAVAKTTGAVNTTTSSDYFSHDSEILSHAWVTQDELKKLLKPKYFQAVRRILH